jgi:hypothetical protein
MVTSWFTVSTVVSTKEPHQRETRLTRPAGPLPPNGKGSKRQVT